MQIKFRYLGSNIHNNKEIENEATDKNKSC